MEPIIGLKSGGAMDFRSPNPKAIDIKDVAHALSHVCRFSGHTRKFYSVAQHSVYVMRRCQQQGFEQAAPWGLLHDAAEYVTGDVSTPLKSYIGQAYRSMYSKVEDAVINAFWPVLNSRGDFNQDTRDIVRKADYDLLYFERDALMPDTKYLYPDERDPTLHPGGTIFDVDPDFMPWTSEQARYEFINAYQDFAVSKPTAFKAA